MPDTLKSIVRLFADDTIVYLTISALTDCHTLQSDLHKLEKWEEEWLRERPFSLKGLWFFLKKIF